MQENLYLCKIKLGSKWLNQISNKMKVKQIFILILGIILFYNSCNFITKPIFSKDEIKLLIETDTIIPTQYSLLTLFCKGDNNHIIKLQHKELKELFDNQLIDSNKKDFLFNLLNQKTSIKTKGRNSFLLNDTVLNEYQNNDLISFFSLYCKKDNAKKYRLNKEISLNKLETLSYLLFLNGYFITFDCYIGQYYFNYKDIWFPKD